jgi:hypothetical protein
MTQRAGHRPAEQDAIRSVAARLTRQFPELRPAEIERAVYGQYGQFEDSPVRDFIPVLVEQGTRRRLARHCPGRHRA